jgi:hypothetical protein
LGRHIADAVVASGDRLIATARDPRRLEDLARQHGDRVRTAPLDVADEDAAHAAVQAAVNAFGRLDVVVNNAGYGDIAPFEQVSSERFKALVDTNFYGVVNGPALCSRSCESREAVTSFRFRPWVVAWPFPAVLLTTPPSGPSEDSPKPWRRRWFRLRQGVRARTRRHADGLGHSRECGYAGADSLTTNPSRRCGR